MPCQAPIKAAGALYLQHVSVQPKLYNRRRTFWSEWRTDNPRYQSAVSQGHDARRQPILRLPRHDAKYFTYATWVFHRWLNWSLTYRRVQDNATGYGKMPIIGSTRVQSWTPTGAAARYQAFDLQNVKIAPMNEFSTHHLDQRRCQAPIIVVACYACQSTLSWETLPGGREGSIWIAEGA